MTDEAEAFCAQVRAGEIISLTTNGVVALRRSETVDLTHADHYATTPETGLQHWKITTFDPQKRAEEKRLSRIEDERKLETGELTRDELQAINGGQGMFRNSTLVRHS